MAISEHLLEQTRLRPGSFVFADGARIAAREYGYLGATSFVLAPATELFETCFKSDDLGPKFPISAVAVRLAAVPHLYCIAFHTGIYLAYADIKLGIDEATRAEIAVGIGKAVDDMRMPNGQSLANPVKRSLISACVSFSKAISDDLRELEAATAQAPKALGAHATKLLLGLIERSFDEGKPGNPGTPVLLKGIGNEHALRLQLLDQRPGRVLSALQNDLQLRFEPALSANA